MCLPQRKSHAPPHPGGYIRQEGRFGPQGRSIKLDPAVACLRHKELVQTQIAVHGDLPVMGSSAMDDRFDVQDTGKGAVFTIRVPDGNFSGDGQAIGTWESFGLAEKHHASRSISFPDAPTHHWPAPVTRPPLPHPSPSGAVSFCAAQCAASLTLVTRVRIGQTRPSEVQPTMTEAAPPHPRSM
jgi:hypothetical protein